MGADYSFYLKTIETHARAFFKVIIFSIGTVVCKYDFLEKLKVQIHLPLFLSYHRHKPIEIDCHGKGGGQRYTIQ